MHIEIWLEIWYGVDDDLVDVAVRQLSSNLWPHSQRSVAVDALVHYQSLRTAANGASAFEFVGATMTAANLTFDNQDSLGWSGNYYEVEPGWRWPIVPPNIGPLPDFRMVKRVGGFIELVDAGDTTAVGATAPPTGQWSAPYEYAQFYKSGFQDITRHHEGVLRIEVESGDEIAADEVVYQGDDGCAASEGTIRIGVSTTGGEGGDVIKVLPSWTD